MRSYFDINARTDDYRKKHRQGTVKAADETEPSTGTAIIRKALNSEMTALISFYNHDGSEFFHPNEDFRFSLHSIPSQGILHRHDFIEILYVIDGEFDQILMGRHLHFTKGSFVIADRNCEHSEYYLPRDSVVLFLQISSALINELPDASDAENPLRQFLFRALGDHRKDQSFMELRPISGRENSSVCRLLEQLYQEAFRHDEGSGFMRRGLLLRLLHVLGEEYTPFLHSDSGNSTERALLWEVESYIRHHCADVSTADLERKFHYHRNYYNLLLKKYCGRTYVEYICNVRMSRALELLRSTNMTVKEIAHSVGYENTGHFYQLFKKKYHCRPHEMRSRG